MSGLMNGSIGDPIIGVGALLALAFAGWLAAEHLQEIHRRWKLQRIRAELRRKHLGHE